VVRSPHSIPVPQQKGFSRVTVRGFWFFCYPQMEPIWTVASELEQQSDPDSARSVSDVATAAAQ
jgi:hypothetical protein